MLLWDRTKLPTMRLPATLTDQVGLRFAKIEVEYRPVKPDGSLDAPVKAGFDVTANKPI